MNLIVFLLENARYSLDVKNVEEIIPLPYITPLANLPSFIRGIINLRGTAVPVVDLRKRIGLKSKSDELNDTVIIVNFHDTITGLIVDRVLYVIDVYEDQFIPSPEMLNGIDVKYMYAAVQVDKQLTVVLNLDNILTLKEREELLGPDVYHADIG
jgi:purine-binding chemotaxis protein CheW